MTLGRLWAGRVFGTSTGNLFVKLDGNDAALNGTVHFNEPGVDLVVYSVRGVFDGHQLALTGELQSQVERSVTGQLTATARLNTRGQLAGEWSTSIGSAGTFILFPHDQAQELDSAPGQLPDQLHTARHHLGAVEVDREQVTAIADELQVDFPRAHVVVTVVAGTEQSRYLANFKTIKIGADKATVIKLFVQEPEGGGVNRIAQVEFGPTTNMVMTQGSDEAWVLGMLEKLKRNARPFERTYATNIKKLGFGINQLLLIGAVVFLPSLGSLQDRAIFMAGVLSLILGVSWLHGRYLPFAAIYLEQKPKSIIERLSPSVISWIIAATASIAATLLAAYLQGWLAIPSAGL